MGLLDKLLKVVQPKKETRPKQEVKPKQAPTPKERKKPTQTASMKFYVAGINYDNDDGSNRWKIVDKFAKDHFSGKQYYGATKEDLEIGEGFYQYTRLSGNGGIEFVPEPDNKFSEKAIKVILTGYGQIGYIPQDEIERFNRIMSKGEYEINWRVSGGRIKYEDGIEEEPYGITIRLYKK